MKLLLYYKHLLAIMQLNFCLIWNRLMAQVLKIQEPLYWLIRAAHYNRLWHQCDDFLRADSCSELSDIESNYYQIRRTLLLNQKQNCQLTALRLTYSKHQLAESHKYSLVIELDPHEKGVKGDGVFYSLYAHQQPHNKCHIPYRVLLENLTTKEQRFFNL